MHGNRHNPRHRIMTMHPDSAVISNFDHCYAKNLTNLPQQLISNESLNKKILHASPFRSLIYPFNQCKFYTIAMMLYTTANCVCVANCAFYWHIHIVCIFHFWYTCTICVPTELELYKFHWLDLGSIVSRNAQVWW